MRLKAILLERVTVRPVARGDKETEGAIRQAFTASRIGPGYYDNPLLAAEVDGKVVGGVFGKWREEDGRWVFSFDTAVQPEARKHRVGMHLLKAAIDLFERGKRRYGDDAMMTLSVVNPDLVPLLVRRYGFRVAQHTYGGAGVLVRE